MESVLKYSDANVKLKKLYKVSNLAGWIGKESKKRVYSLDLLSGWACPFAKTCLSKVHETGEFSKAGNSRVKLQDGKDNEFRCFSASQEAIFPSVYRKRKQNFDTLRGLNLTDMIDRINSDIPKNAGIIRQHVGGDFFNSKYFLAWLNVAKMNPKILFYAYTKSLRYWVKYRELVNELDNVVLTASRGGQDDDLIGRHGLRESIVVFSEAEAKERNLEIDHDDSHAADPYNRCKDFALLIHGGQPAGSEAGKAVSALKGLGSYGRKTVNA
jgi:hypothetical protein